MCRYRLKCLDNEFIIGTTDTYFKKFKNLRSSGTGSSDVIQSYVLGITIDHYIGFGLVQQRIGDVMIHMFVLRPHFLFVVYCLFTHFYSENEWKVQNEIDLFHLDEEERPPHSSSPSQPIKFLPGVKEKQLQWNGSFLRMTMWPFDWKIDFNRFNEMFLLFH